MHKMRTIAIDDLSAFFHSVSQFVCRWASRGFAVQKKAKRIEVLPGEKTLRHRKNTALDESTDFPLEFDAAFDKLLWPRVTVRV